MHGFIENYLEFYIIQASEYLLYYCSISHEKMNGTTVNLP